MRGAPLEDLCARSRRAGLCDRCGAERGRRRRLAHQSRAGPCGRDERAGADARRSRRRAPGAREGSHHLCGHRHRRSDHRAGQVVRHPRGDRRCGAQRRRAMAQDSVEACCAALDTAGVPAAKVQTIDEVLADPQTLARGMVVEQDHPLLGKIRLPNLPFAFPTATPRPAAWRHCWASTIVKSRRAWAIRGRRSTHSSVTACCTPKPMSPVFPRLEKKRTP